MGTLKRLWGGTRDDVVKFGGAGNSVQPGVSPKASQEEKRRARLTHLDRNGPKQMSEAGYERVRKLLTEAQARPAGQAKRRKKAAKHLALSIDMMAKAPPY